MHVEVTDRAAYEAVLHGEELTAAWRYEQELVRRLRWRWFTSVAGWCCICAAERRFRIWRRSVIRDGVLDSSNLRNSLACRGCRQLSRQRKVFELLQQHTVAGQRVYLTEQRSDLFRLCRERLTGRQVTGSEFVDAVARPGSESGGVRHEDLQRLSFASASQDVIACCDVLEHVPDHRQALRELARVLAPGGQLLVTIPFRSDLDANVCRARVHADGGVEHLLPAVHHRDPFREAGSLVFTDFGWQFLQDLEDAGLRAGVALYWSREHACLGVPSQVFFGRKAERNPSR